MGLALIGIVILFVWGLALIVTAHPVHPVRVIGHVSDRVDIYDGSTYRHTELRLKGDERLFTMIGPAMQPPLPLNDAAPGDLVALWVDPDLSWVDLTKTDIFAISLGMEGLALPAHTDQAYEHPAAQADRQRLVGAGVLGLVAVILGLGYLWDRLDDRTSRKPEPRFGPPGKKACSLGASPVRGSTRVGSRRVR